MSPENALNAFDQYNAMVRELATKQDLPLADIRSVVGPESKNWGDATHFSQPGSALRTRSHQHTDTVFGVKINLVNAAQCRFQKVYWISPNDCVICVVYIDF